MCRKIIRRGPSEDTIFKDGSIGEILDCVDYIISVGVLGFNDKVHLLFFCYCLTDKTLQHRSPIDVSIRVSQKRLIRVAFERVDCELKRDAPETEVIVGVGVEGYAEGCAVAGVVDKFKE